MPIASLESGSNLAHEIVLSFGSSEQEKPNSSSSVEVKLKVDRDSGIGGADWPAANLFCHVVASDPFYASVFDNKTVLELGSGTGLGGIVVDKLFNASRVVITDLELYRQHILQNVGLNVCSDRVQAAALDWTDMAPFAAEYPASFDVILALECVYREDLYQPLVDVLLRTSSKKTLVFLGLTRLFAQTKFFALLEAAGLRYTRIPEHALPAVLRGQQSTADCGLLLLYFQK